MKLKLPIAIAASLLMSGSAFADGNIKGTVFNKTTSQPLDFASVALVNAATGEQLPIGTATDENGQFIIANAPSGRYIVRVSMIGNVTQEREITVGNAEVDLGKILLAEDSKLLQEVVVTGHKSQMSVNADHRVFNVSSNIASTGASANELLAAVPSVDVSTDGKISLRGKTDVMVWIDGKEMGMNADNRAQILSQIPAETIESIEVMTNPSSKHSTEGTAGIINIKLKEDHRHGYFGTAEADVDSRGTANLNFNINFNEGKFESFAGIGLKTQHQPSGSTSYRDYADGSFLNSEGESKKHENSAFLRLGTKYRPNEANTFYVSAIGTLGHKWGRTLTTHKSNLPGQWMANVNNMHEDGDNRGANVLLGYTHEFDHGHTLDMNVSYNVWRGLTDNKSVENATWADATEETTWRTQHQDVKISNWEAALDYGVQALPWLRFEAGYKGNYNREDSPASFAGGPDEQHIQPLNDLYNRFKYDTDISALYVNFEGNHGPFNFSAGLRGEAWQIRTRSLTFGQTEADVKPFKENDFQLFPSASIGWEFENHSEMKLNYSRRISRPFGPQLNTFENIADPSEVHLGNPNISPEYSNAVELTYIKNWTSGHMLSLSAYMRANNNMISHISFLAPMASDPNVNTMYYGHANVGKMRNTGVEIISRNTLFKRLTLTTTVNLYNSRHNAWSTEYPLHGKNYLVSGAKQNRFVWDVRCMASVHLPWEMTFQATGRYNARRVTAQGTLEPDWEVEAGLRKNVKAWSFSLLCKDIFNSKKSHNVLYGNGYTQSISKWVGGRTLRLAVTFTFGKQHDRAHGHDDDHDEHDGHDHDGEAKGERRNHVDTGGYGEEHNHNH
ncbi:MAG: outer membrane beta-barrel family protein [Bacteroidales bacterium]|nr:outer membrane beta-barrel family protein [Bacteroidales bacterium]